MKSDTTGPASYSTPDPQTSASTVRLLQRRSTRRLSRDNARTGTSESLAMPFNALGIERAVGTPITSRFVVCSAWRSSTITSPSPFLLLWSNTLRRSPAVDMLAVSSTKMGACDSTSAAMSIRSQSFAVGRRFKTSHGANRPMTAISRNAICSEDRYRLKIDVGRFRMTAADSAMFRVSVVLPVGGRPVMMNSPPALSPPLNRFRSE